MTQEGKETIRQEWSVNAACKHHNKQRSMSPGEWTALKTRATLSTGLSESFCFSRGTKIPAKSFLLPKKLCTEEVRGQIKPLMASKHPDLRHSSTSFLGPCSAHKLLLWPQETGLLGPCLFSATQAFLVQMTELDVSTATATLGLSRVQRVVGPGREGTCGLPRESHLRALSKERTDLVCQRSTGAGGCLQRAGFSGGCWSYH